MPKQGQQYDRHVVYVNQETFSPELSITRFEVVITNERGVYLISVSKMTEPQHITNEHRNTRARRNYVFVPWSDWPAHTRSQGKTWISYQPVTQQQP